MARMDNRFRVLLILFLVVLALPVFAEFKDIRICKNPEIDGWSVVRIGAGGLVYGGFRAAGLSPKASLVWTGIIAYAWEIYVDGYQNNAPFNIYPPDPRGAEFLADPIFVILGAAISYTLDLLFQNLNKRQIVRLTSRGKSITLSIPL